MKRKLLIVAAALAVVGGLALAPAAEEAQGHPQTAPDAQRSKTALSQLAEAMKAGSWAELKTDGLTGALRKAPPPGRGLDIMGWTDDAHWNSRTGQFLYMGMRQTRRFIAYAEKTNSWRGIPFAGEKDAPHLENQYGHIYGNNAHDPENAHFYHLYHGGRGIKVQDIQPGGISFLDLTTGKWARLPSAGRYAMTGCIEYFSARKGLVVLGGQGNVRFFSDQRQAWEKLGTVPVCGHHSLARHNPFRQEVLLAGGNDSKRKVVRLDKAGRLEPMKDAPVDLGVRHDKLTVDPVSGRYLMLNFTEKKLYEFDSRTNTYRLADDFTKTPWPFGRYDMPVVAFVPEHGVTMWVASKVWLYKHDAGQTDSNDNQK